MTTHRKRSIDFPIKLQYSQEPDGSWKGTTFPFGLLLRADSSEEIEAKAERTVEFCATTVVKRDGLEALTAYLDRHAVDYNVTYNKRAPVDLPPVLRLTPDSRSVEHRQKVFA